MLTVTEINLYMQYGAMFRFFACELYILFDQLLGNFILMFECENYILRCEVYCDLLAKSDIYVFTLCS